MIKRTLILGVLTGSLAWSGELQPKHLPANTEWFVHIDAAKAMESGFAKQIARSAESAFSEQIQRVKGFYYLFSPVMNIRGITVHGDGTLRGGAVLIDGTFNQSQVASLLQAASGYETQSIDGTTIHSWKVNNLEFLLAFHGENVALFGQNKEVFHEALATIKDPSKALKSASDVAAGSIMAAGANLNAMNLPEGISRVAQNIKSFSATIHSDGGQFFLDGKIGTPGAEHATALKSTTQALITLISEPRLESIASHFETRVEGSVLQFRLKLPEPILPSPR